MTALPLARPLARPVARGVRVGRGNFLSRVLATLFSNDEPGFLFTVDNVADFDWRRNLLQRTEEFDDAASWAKDATTVSANVGIAPNGTTTADNIIPNTNNSAHGFQRSISASGTVTQSIYAKNAGYNFVGLTFNNSSATAAFFNLTTGAVTSVGASLTDTKAEDVGDGWWRISITTAGGCTFVRNYVAQAANFGAFAGDGTSGVLIWGAQLELGSTATEYQRIRTPEIELAERFPKALAYTTPDGTVPAVVGGTVGLWLDQSRGLKLGPELVDTANDASAWAPYGNNTVSQDGDAVRVDYVDNAGGAFIFLRQTGGLSEDFVSGRAYRLQVQLRINSGSANFMIFQTTLGNYIDSTPITSAEYTTRTYVFRYVSGNPYIQFANLSAGETVWIRNISVRELPGAHATQATPANRPILGRKPVGGRRNLLERTEEFGDAYWSRQRVSVDPVAAEAPTGENTATKLKEDVSAENNPHILVPNSNAFSTTPNASYIATFYAKEAERRHAVFGIRSSGAGSGSATAGPSRSHITVDLRTGAASQLINVATHSVTDVGNGWWKIVIATAGFDRNDMQPAITLSNVAAPAIGNFMVVNYAGDGTSGIFIWGAQFELGSTATPYQRVGSRFDVTEAGKPNRHYLYFGGASDPRWMQTPFSGAARNDFVGTYWAGYRQGPDQTGYICHASGSATTTSTIGFAHLLSASEDRIVLSNVNSISQSPNTARIAMADWDRNVPEGTFGFNGSRSAASIGTGSQNEILTIGCRTATSPNIFYEGELSAMILREGGGLTTPEIVLVERFTASKVAEPTL